MGEGYQVTSRLLENARERFRAPEEKSLAGLLATGESRSAALVSLALDDAGIRNELLDPDRIKLRVRGARLDAEPIDVDLGALHICKHRFNFNVERIS